MKTSGQWTEIICILDRSGSMAELTEDTIGGFNTFLERQRELEGRARVTLALFDDQYEVPWEHRDLKSAPKLDDKVYFARGSTALLDAVGRTIATVAARIRTMDAAEQPSTVTVLVVTDGYENASREYTAAKVKELVEERQAAGWEFVFLGADVDAFSAASGMGMTHGSSSKVAKSSQGSRELYSKLNRAVTNMRTNGTKGDVDAPLDEDGWL